MFFHFHKALMGVLDVFVGKKLSHVHLYQLTFLFVYFCSA